MKYKTLFTIEILHDYFKDGKADDIIFTPTRECQLTLKGIKSFTKSWLNKLYVIVPSLDGTHPIIALPSECVFEFYWSPADVQFFSYSVLPVTSSNRYHCHNAHSSVRDGKNYLHVLPPIHVPSKSYPVGSFVSDSGDKCFESLANLGSGNSLSDSNQWVDRGKVAYLNAEQMLAFQGGMCSFEVNPPAAVVNVQAFGWNHATNDLSTFLLSKDFIYEDPISRQQIDFRSFQSGMYRFSVNGTEHIVYIDIEDNWHGEAGMISIFHNGFLPSSNALTNGSGGLLSPTYSIRIAPPTVIWQYQARTSAVKKVEDESGQILFDASPPTFTSKLPIRIQQQASDKMMLEYNNTSPPDPLKTVVVKKLPVPGPGAWQKINKNSTDYMMATIQLNY